MNQLRIHSQQLVAEALSYMRNGEVEALPVYDKDQFVGKVTYQDLMTFLNHKDEIGDIYAHKMNFDIETAMLMIKRSNPDFLNQNVKQRSFSKQLLVGLGSAAIVSLVLIGLSHIFFNKHANPEERNHLVVGTTPAKVMLTLADGKKIALNDAKTGLVVGASKLSYSDGSSINYQHALNDASLYGHRSGTAPVYKRQMMLNVPSGGLYRVVLPDGSKVWLNAASSLKFPVSFDGATKRRVELNGEAYFEIAKATFKPHGQGGKEQRLPFIVVTNNQEIEVLGTHFNVCAYDNEKAIKTTLVEGSIRLRSSAYAGKLPGTMDPASLDPLQIEEGRRTYGNGIVLKPNQEATLIGDQIVIKYVDANDAFAWTDGEYIFRNTSLETVMHTITRWYDVEVVYEQEQMGATLLGGAISRSSKIADVLKMLELTANVHFKVEGKRITVVE